MSVRVVNHRSTFQRNAAFTLVELIVSTALIVLLMVVLLTTIDQTQRVWSRGTAKITQFQASRSAFEALTRNLSQATLNTYYNVEYDTTGNPKAYYRESELHFVSGRAGQAKLLGADPIKYPTQAVFFQAPLGVSAEMKNDTKKYGNLGNLLTAAGYYIEWGEDQSIPDFLRTSGQTNGAFSPRYRYRLMEVLQPAESLSIYSTADFFKDTSFKTTTDWIQAALGNRAPSRGGAAQKATYVRAENIIALVLLPKIPEKDRTPKGSQNLDLAPEYEYDTRPADANGKPLRKESVNVSGKAEQRKQFNQLPPIIQVTMVAIDETSASRQQDITGQAAPNWTDGLFQKCKREDDFTNDLGDPVNPQPDSLIGRLTAPGGSSRAALNYRVYTADVIIRGSKWSAVD